MDRHSSVTRANPVTSFQRDSVQIWSRVDPGECENRKARVASWEKMLGLIRMMAKFHECIPCAKEALVYMN